MRKSTLLVATLGLSLMGLNTPAAADTIHAIERQAVDRRPQANILAQFGGGRELPAEALEFDMVLVRATVYATRFVDQKAISE